MADNSTNTVQPTETMPQSAISIDSSALLIALIVAATIAIPNIVSFIKSLKQIFRWELDSATAQDKINKTKEDGVNASKLESLDVRVSPLEKDHDKFKEQLSDIQTDIDDRFDKMTNRLENYIDKTITPLRDQVNQLVQALISTKK